MNHILQKLVQWIDFIYPPVCIVCDQWTGVSGEWVCGNCWEQLEMIETPVTSGLKSAHELDEVRSVFVYNDAVKTIIHHLKYQRAINLSAPLAKYSTFILSGLQEWMMADMLLPIPLHPVKLRERGYNQSEELGKAFSGETGIPMKNNILFRRLYTVSQTQMGSAAGRQKNMRDAFKINPKAVIAGKKIILIDDVVTTGSTANACASILKTAGASKIFLLTLAHPVFNN